VLNVRDRPAQDPRTQRSGAGGGDIGRLEHPGILLVVQNGSGEIGSMIVRSSSTKQNQEAGRERHVGCSLPLITWHASGYCRRA